EVDVVGDRGVDWHQVADEAEEAFDRTAAVGREGFRKDGDVFDLHRLPGDFLWGRWKDVRAPADGPDAGDGLLEELVVEAIEDGADEDHLLRAPGVDLSR